MSARILILTLLAWPLVASAQPDPRSQAGDDRPCTCPSCVGPGMGPGMMGPGMGSGMMGPGMGSGMMGRGMMDDDWGGGGPRMMGVPADALGLSDKQRARVSEIQGDLIKPMWDLATKVDEQRAKLYDAFAADPVDAKRVREITGTIGQLHQQMAELKVEAHNEMMKLLTKEQREQLATLRQGTSQRRPSRR